jgi:hypothetical protein
MISIEELPSFCTKFLLCKMEINVYINKKIFFFKDKIWKYIYFKVNIIVINLLRIYIKTIYIEILYLFLKIDFKYKIQ